jgi:hypothetical protein
MRQHIMTKKIIDVRLFKGKRQKSTVINDVYRLIESMTHVLPFFLRSLKAGRMEMYN